MSEYKNLKDCAYILNPISNINGYLTSAEEIFDLEQNQSQAALNKLIKLNSGVSEIQEFYAIYNSPAYGGNTEEELREMINDSSIDWIRIPGGEFPRMTPDNPYLWNYEKFIQTNGDNIITLPHVTGTLGRGYKTIKRSYLVNNDDSKKPSTNDSSWSPQSPATTKENPFLWEKQEIYYTDNLEEANPDETIITLIGVMGEPGVDGTQIEYIFRFSDSKLKAPENPTPGDWKDNIDYQKSDFIPFPQKKDHDNNPEEIKYYWSDEPVGVSKENPAQWICKREYTFNKETGRVLWGKFSDPKLYSTYGEDGVSIVSIQTWYLISDVNTLEPKIENAVNGEDGTSLPNYWYKNSPAVDKVNRYLWKKTITTYSAALFDDPNTESNEAELNTSTSYEVIGSMGDPGVDGDSVEWIYTRTKTGTTPEINSLEIYFDKTVTDKNYSDFQKPDFIPYPRIEDFNKGYSEYYWSDDIQEVDDTYIYGWRAQRKKINGVWGDFSLPIKILYKAKDGVSPNTSFKSIIFCRSEKDLNLTDESGKKLYTIPSEVEINENTSYNTFDYPIPPSSKYPNTDINIVWSDGIPGGTEKLWSSTRIFSSDGRAPQQESWTEPKVMSDSTDIEIIYCARENKNYIDPNSLGNIILENGELTKAANDAGWFDEPNQIENDTNKTDVTPIWMAISRSVNGIWSNWEISKIKGERGNDGTSITIKGSYDTLTDFTNVWFDEENNKWKNPEGEETAFIVAGRLWVWNGSDKWEDVGQFKGDPGKTYYLHIIYAKSATTKDNGSFYVTESDLTDNGGIVPGKYIATWTDDKQGISITQELLDSLIWSKWVGNDGYGYEYIYKLSKTETPEKLPLLDDWDTNEDYQKPDYCPTDWSDNPLNVSKESPYCWQAYRVKIDGIWQPWQGHADTDEAALWSKYGKDGKGINNIIYSFCINNENNYESFIENLPDNNEDPEADNLPNSEEDIQSNHWYKNSPSVTEEYPCLWKKTITTYTEKNTDDTEGLETQTTYELIGVKGARGVDGNDIEWAFKLTSTFDQPTSKDYDWPTGEITSQVPGKWTDDAQEVSSEYPYQWVINRTKSNSEWTPWGTPVYTEGESSPNYYKAILNNTYGNYIINSESYYKVSTSEKISSFVPNSEYLSLEEYQDSLINLEWKKSSDNGTLTPDPINDKLYEISILIFSDNTYSVSGPVVKGIWTGRDIQSTVFCRSNYIPATPTGGTYNEPWPKNTDENGELIWSDGIPDRNIKDESDNIIGILPSTVWSSTAIFVPGGEGPKNGWSTPIQLTDTSSLQIRYYDGETLPTDDNNNIIKPTSLIPDENNQNENIENWNKEWTETASQNTVWMATRSYSYGEWSDWQIIKIKGETGKDSSHPNLFLNSGFEAESDPFKYWIVDSRGETGYSLSEKSGEQGTNGISGTYDLSYNITDRIIPGETYTISFRLSFMSKNSVKIDLGGLIKSEEYLLNYSIENLNGPTSNGGLLVLTPNDDNFVNRKVFFTFKTNDSLEDGEQLIFKLISNDETYGYTTHSLKLETGSVVTDYSRAQEDLRGKDGKDGSDGRDGKDGTSPIYADLDNELDSIPLSYLGLVEKDTKLTTNVSIWRGIEKLQLTSLSADLTVGKPESIVFEDGDIDLESGRITCTIYKDIELDSRNVITIYLSAEGEDRVLTFTINGVKAGAKGENAKIYQLSPTSSQIIRKNDGSTEPQNLTINAIRTVGNEITSSEDGKIVEGEITYVIDGVEQELTLAPGGVITGDLLKTINRSLKLVYKVGGILVDSETIPVIRDGIDGKGSVTVDIDNEMDSIALDHLGYPISTDPIVTHVRLWLGTEERTIKEITVGDLGGFDKEVTLSGNPATVGTVIFTPNGEVISSRNVSTISLVDTEGIDRSVTFTISAVRSGENGSPARLYKIQTSHNQIKKDNQNTIFPETINCNYLTIEGDIISTAPTDNVKLRYYIDGILQETVESSLSIQTELISKSLKLELIKIDSEDNIIVIDSETIPVISDGINGLSANSNLIRNSNFDIVYSNNPQKLVYYSKSNGEILIDGYSGYNVAYNNVSGAGAVFEQVVKLEEGKIYTLSGYAKNTSGTNDPYKNRCSGWSIRGDKSFGNEFDFSSYRSSRKGISELFISEGKINISFGQTTDWEFKSITFKYNGPTVSVILAILYQWSTYEESTTTPSPDQTTTPSPYTTKSPANFNNEINLVQEFEDDLIETFSETVISESYISCVKLEEGEVATPYSKHIDDYKSPIKNTVFKNSSNLVTPEIPIGGTYNNPVPEGWSEGIPSRNDGPIWSSTNTFYPGDINLGWSEPKLMSDGDGFDVYYSSKEIPGTPPPAGSKEENNDWKKTVTNNAVWIATSNKSSGGSWSDWTIAKIRGDVGPAGTMGRNMYPAGNWNSNVNYKIENNSVPFVFYNSNYYILTADEGEVIAGFDNAPDKNTEKWGIFTYTPFQFSEFLMANWAKFGGQNGAVFYDRYLFSQLGHGDKKYEDFIEGNPMFDSDGNLSGTFIPKLHLDFYNGLANLSCLCEPYITYPKGSSDFESGVIRIDPHKGFNIKIGCDSPSSYYSDYPLDMRHPIVILPKLNSIEEKNTWAMDGSHITILFENGGINYGKLSQLSNPEINKQNIFLLVSVDDSCLEYGINSGRGDYDSNYIYSNNRRGKYLIMSPGSMVKMKVNVIETKDDYGKDISYLYWVVENSGSVSGESVNVYSTSEEFDPSGISGVRTLVEKYYEEDTTNISGAVKNTTLIPFHGADLTDSINLNSGAFLPENWGMMFYSGPKGFCPKNIIFSYGNNGFKYRALDFKGRVNNDGDVITLDNCIGFDWDPL